MLVVNKPFNAYFAFSDKEDSNKDCSGTFILQESKRPNTTEYTKETVSSRKEKRN